MGEIARTHREDHEETGETGQQAGYDSSGGLPLPQKSRDSYASLSGGRREKAAQRAEAAQLSNLTIRQRLSHELDARKEQIPALLDALYEKAKRGDVPAARELRGWYDQGLGRPEAASLDTAGVDERSYADMTPEERARLRAALIKRIAEAEAELEEGDA